MEYELAFINALLTTVLLECFMVALLKKFFGGRLKLASFSYVRLIGFTAIASMLTLPYAWFVLPAFFSGLTYIIVAEVSVTLIEAAFYGFAMRIPWWSAVVLAVAANAFSYTIGVLI